jgi:hypothetical protein
VNKNHTHQLTVTVVSGTGITGGGFGYAAILAHAGGAVRYRLGDLKENWFLLFSN